MTAALTISAAATTRGLGREMMKDRIQMAQNSVSGVSGGQFDDKGFLAGLGRKLIKRIQTSSGLPKDSSNQLKTARVMQTKTLSFFIIVIVSYTFFTKHSSTAQNGPKRLKYGIVNVGSGREICPRPKGARDLAPFPGARSLWRDTGPLFSPDRGGRRKPGSRLCP